MGLTLRVQERLAPQPQKVTSRAAPQKSAEADLEACIKARLGGEDKINVQKFKNFLEMVQNWVCTSTDHSLEKKQNALGENGKELLSAIAKHNPAFAAQLQNKEDNQWINQNIQVLSSTLGELSTQHKNINRISVTDKVLQIGLTEDGSKLLSESLAKTTESVKFSDKSHYSKAEQKAILFTALENAMNTASQETSTEKRATALSNSLNESLAEHAFKLDKNFVLEAAKEISANSDLIGSINNGLANPKLINHVTRGADALSIEERAAKYAEAWSQTLKNTNISAEEIKNIKMVTDDFIANLGELIRTDSRYDIRTEEGTENTNTLIEAFRTRNQVPENALKAEIDKAALLNEATTNYLDLVINKAAETQNIKKDSNSIFGSQIFGDQKLEGLIGQGIAAIVLFTAFKALTSGNSHMANGLGMQAAGGGGFMKKALGLVFMATVMNNTGLMSGLQDETKNTITPLSSTKDETENSTQSLLKTAASALLGV
ncbi:MAG: hypothetical protein KGO93_04970 [Cyanobacteria bacterium REEB446]|nr:hypothetical protein [Cyanobacteria bacterium REEB446]